MLYKEIDIRTEGSMEDAKLEAYILDTPADKLKIQKRPMVIICPGGGYRFTSYREGEPLAMHFLNQGYHACVLRYSVAPVRFPVPLIELARAMKVIHEKAEDWRINEDGIFVQGSSAGGHLAGMLGVFWHKDFLAKAVGVDHRLLRPAGIILSYPVIGTAKEMGELPSFQNLLGERFEQMKEVVSLEKQVTEHMPPCFLWHTATDGTVPVENSLLMAMALKKAGVAMELHIFPNGEHGLSLASSVVERQDGSGVNHICQTWINLADAWIKNQLEGD